MLDKSIFARLGKLEMIRKIIRNLNDLLASRLKFEVYSPPLYLFDFEIRCVDGKTESILTGFIVLMISSSNQEVHLWDAWGNPNWPRIETFGDLYAKILDSRLSDDELAVLIALKIIEINRIPFSSLSVLVNAISPTEEAS